MTDGGRREFRAPGPEHGGRPVIGWCCRDPGLPFFHPGHHYSVMSNGKQLIVVGDRVLIEPEEGEDRSKVGLYLPATAVDKQAVQAGTIAATGPGTPISAPTELDDEPWRITSGEPRFLPVQAQVGDYAIFFRRAAVEITFEQRKYLVVPQAAILVLLRGAPGPGRGTSGPDEGW